MNLTNSPFSVSNKIAYQYWRERKLKNFSNDINTLMVTIDDISHLQQNEINTLFRLINRYNLALYRFKNPHSTPAKNKQKVTQLAKHFGLNRLDKNICADKDKLTSITVSEHKGQHQYIPYSNKRLSWHTDGYYNAPDQQIHALVLHCEHPAQSGGESLLLDHEIAYILLRDENPDYIKALSHPNAMSIPANILNGKEIRPAQSGPVFSINTTGGLHMRYSARTRNIQWRQDSMTLEAVTFLQNLWKSNSPYILRYTLQAHEGLLCKNILHCRTAFKDNKNPKKKRLLYRGRYFDQFQSKIESKP